ncbi:MAG: metal-dependent phosphohydrolase [Alphaproteobacteria bacterium]|jgi:hypothetical protein|nr:metal-dependent phosphohydrolase [Alphaproteobacteria bacterium]
MFDPTALAIDAFLDPLREEYLQTYGQLEPNYPGIIAFTGRMSLECIAGGDAPYHDVRHTMMVTQAGQAILRGKHLSEGGVGPRDWLHAVLSMLFHDIGFVRGLLRDDREDEYVTDEAGGRITLMPGASDAALCAYHIDRGKRFVRERFAGHAVISAEVICDNIERTRFPVPDLADCRITDDMPGLVRAADFIGQLGDINHTRNLSALYTELQETGTAARLGFHSAADLRRDYPAFFWRTAKPHLEPALQYLRATQEGRAWIARLYANVFAEEHALACTGPERAAGGEVPQAMGLR